MVAGQGVSTTAARDRAPHYVLRRPVVLDEIQVHRDEILDPVSKVPGQGEGLQEDLRQEHGRSDIEVHPAVPKVGDDRGQEAEVPMACLPHGRPVTAGMHVHDIGPQGNVHRAGHLESRARGEETMSKMRRLSPKEPFPHGAAEP